MTVRLYTGGASIQVIDEAPVAPPVVVATLVRELVDLTRVIAFDRQLGSGARYERFMRHTSINVTTSVHKINCDDITQGGLAVAFPHHHYGVEFAPLLPDATLGAYVERGRFTPAGAKTANVTVTLGAEPDGWSLARIVARDASDAVVPFAGCVKYWMVIDRNGQAKNSPFVVRQSGNYDWDHVPLPAFYSYVIYSKADVTPRARPIPARDTVTPFATALSSPSIARVALLPGPDTTDHNAYYPTLTDRGVLVCENQQGYAPTGMFKDLPSFPLVDGPRGVCTAPYTLTLRGGRNGKVYGMTPWCLYVMDATGTKRTLAGLKNVGTPPYWETPITSVTDPRIAIVGDWATVIPSAERYPREPWAFDWDPRSLLLDTAAAPINGEQPHLPYTAANGDVINGPRYFWTDSLNRLAEGQTNGSDRAVPHKLRVRIAGLGDPWGMVVSGTSIYIAERGAHRISEYNIETWAKVRDVVADPGSSVIGSVGAQIRRFAWAAGQSMTTARARVCVAPEGLALFGRWLYVGSMAKGEVERIHLDTGVREHVCYPTINFGGVGSYFVNIAVSDGTFGPAGTVFTTTFLNSNLGKPEAWVPNGAGWGYQQFGRGVDFGAGGNFDGSHYALGVSVHEGRLFCSDSGGAVNYFCKSDGYDKPIDAVKAEAGWRAWMAGGHNTAHGPHAINQTTKPLPWGVDPNMDYWMTNVLRVA